MTDFLDERRNSLEEAFFARHNQKLLEKLRAKTAADELSKALGEASGIHDPAVIERLITAGISAETAAAVALVPLIAVAWVDGKIDPPERRSILEAAEKKGLQAGTPSRELLESWLAEAPPPELFAAWKSYVETLRSVLGEEAAAALKEEILGRAKEVAQSSGGVLGFGSVSFSESKKLEEIERILG